MTGHPIRSLPMWVALVAWLVAIALLAPTLAYAAEPVELGTEIDRLPTREKVVALTFDDSWIDADLEALLDILREAGIRATFFPNGVKVEESPEMARRVVMEGHEFGSHAYTHDKLEAMTRDELLSQIQRTEEAFSAAGLSDPSPLFRAPWGEVNRQVLEVLGEEGYVHVHWTARGGDTVAHRSAAQVVVYIMADIRPGAIILLHTNNDVAPVALTELIRRLKAKGYGFVTLSEALLSPEQRAARYQQTSPLLNYLGEWETEQSVLESGGSLSRSEDAEAAVLVAFTGSSLELMARTGPDCGKLEVAIDGQPPEESDLYSPDERHRVSVFRATDLSDGRHVALISRPSDREADTASGYVDLDAVKVSGWLNQAPTLPGYVLAELFRLAFSPFRTQPEPVPSAGP